MSNCENTKIYLIRHAQSQMNAAKKLTGWTDVDLSQHGILQAASGKEYFANIKIDRIYASTLQRAYKTAYLIFGNNAQITQLDEFKEINVGLFEMKTHESLLNEYPKIYSDWITDPTLSTPPEGETVYDYYDRVIKGLERVINENIGKTVAIVSHGGVIRCMAIYALNMRLNDLWKLKMDNLSVSCIEFCGERKALTLLNDTCHLKDIPSFLKGLSHTGSGEITKEIIPPAPL